MTSAVKMTMTKTHIKTKTNMKTMTMTKCLKDPPHVLTAAPKFLRAYNVKSSSALFADNIL